MRDGWQTLARVCVVLAIGTLVYAWVGYTNCVVAVANGMTRELNPLTERDLEALIDRALPEGQTAPPAFGARAKLAHPVCYKDHSIADNGLFYALFVVFVVLGLFARNQSRLRRAGPTAEGRSHGSEVGPRRPVRDLPSEIEVGDDLQVGLSEKDKRLLEAVGDIDHRDESLMLYLQKEQAKAEEESEGEHDIGGFFCPPGYHDKPILYVDPGHAAASDSAAGPDPVGEPDRPFATISGAIEAARRLLQEGSAGVMVRIMPGVYHASIDVPDKVVICNHRMPMDGTPRARLKWLTAQAVDTPDNVTILAPTTAEYAVRFEAGAKQGLFGCHVVGRDGLKQAGIVAVSCRALAIVNCSVENFIGGAIRLQDAGTELAGHGVIVSGCRIHKNEARIGGALYAERSSITISDSVVERNKALSGGAIYGIDLRAPLHIVDSRIAHNRAQLDEAPKLDLERTPLERWAQLEGLGGGVYLLNSKLKVEGAEFVENGASVAGGGVALLNARAVLDKSDQNSPRFARNKSRIGAGLAVVGWHEGRTTVKCSGAAVEKNVATIAGGGCAVIGISTVQVFEGHFTRNEIADEAGVGGAIAVLLGGELLAAGTEFFENTSAGPGGALAVVNARLSLRDKVVLRANVAGASGGAIYAVTTASELATQLVNRKVLKVPFAITIDDTKISNNVSTQLGGGLRGGNELGVATLPIGFRVGEDVRFQLNRTKSQQEHGDDFWVVWAGEVKANDRDRPDKLVLR